MRKLYWCVLFDFVDMLAKGKLDIFCYTKFDMFAHSKLDMLRRCLNSISFAKRNEGTG